MKSISWPSKRLKKGARGTCCPGRGGRGALPCMGYIGLWGCEGYSFQTVYSRIGQINQSFWSSIGYHFSRNWPVGWRFYIDKGNQELPLKNTKKLNWQSLNLCNSTPTVLIDGCDKTLVDIINCQKSGFRHKSVVLQLLKINQIIYCSW